MNQPYLLVVECGYDGIGSLLFGENQFSDDGWIRGYKPAPDQASFGWLGCKDCFDVCRCCAGRKVLGDNSKCGRRLTHATYVDALVYRQFGVWQQRKSRRLSDVDLVSEVMWGISITADGVG